MATYLAPAPTPSNLMDDGLEDALQAVVVGITGLPAALVRPRWQPTPPNMPGFDQDWAAIGVQATTHDKFVYLVQISESSQLLERDQEMELMLSCYGPNAQNTCERFIDGVQIQYNRQAWTDLGIKLVDVSDPRRLPALLKETWQNRIDCKVNLRRRIRRVYAVPSIVGVPGSYIDNEHYLTPINVPPPPP